MSKIGQARVLTGDQFAYLIEQIQQHRHPEKNSLIMQISFKLGLRVQEIALLRIREVAELGSQYAHGYKLKDVLVLPKNFTKGARATKGKANTTSRTVRFTVDELALFVDEVIALSEAGKTINLNQYFKSKKKPGGKTRELPLADTALRNAITAYLDHRLDKEKTLKMNNPLILSQKGSPYSPNTLQDHMALMLKKWANVERSSSHSGRRSLASKLLHEQDEHLKTVQQILGHKNAATTTIYQELPESEIREALKKVGDSYE